MKLRFLLLVLSIALLLAGCGGGGAASTSTDRLQVATGRGSLPVPSTTNEGEASAGTGRNSSEAKNPQSKGPQGHADSATGAAVFKVRGGDNSIQESGTEASPSELAAAARALHGYLDARAASAWRSACSFMAGGAAASLDQPSGAKHASCPQLLASLSAGLPAAALREAAIADVGALRVKGQGGFLLFHGAHDLDYFMPMRHEGGEWKVAAIAPSPLG